MWFIFVSLILGFIVGALKKPTNTFKKYINAVTFIFITLLLFVMGISIGTNKDIIKDLGKIGLTSLTYAFFAVLFSILAVYLLTDVLFKGKKT